MITIGHFKEGVVSEPIEVKVFEPLEIADEQPCIRLNVRPIARRENLSTLVKMTPQEALDLARELIRSASARRPL